MKIRVLCLLVGSLVLLTCIGGSVLAAGKETATPQELVASYDSLAEVLLGAQKTEQNLVHAILATTYGHAEAMRAQIRAKLDAGKSASAEIEQLAALVGQLGNEGDAAVAGVRKRLVEGGHHHHHHHAAADTDAEYDPGFVIVTRKAKKVFLDSAGRIGRMASAPDAAKLDAEWKTVSEQYRALFQ